MKVPPTPSPVLRQLLRRQDGVMTAAQALDAGLSRRQLRTLTDSGWKRPFRGIYIAPTVADPFRTSVRSALLACPSGSAHGVTAARLYRLWGLPAWKPSEMPALILPEGQTFNPRRGLRLHTGLRPEDRRVVDGFPAANLSRTLHQLGLELKLDDLVCAVDSALRCGWAPVVEHCRGRKSLARAIPLSDARSESPLETYGRLVLVRAGLAPEVLQYELVDDQGRLYRFDMAWPSARLAVEFDGRAYHEDPAALHRDRSKANAAAIGRWRLIRFTWYDVLHRPEHVIAIIRKALSER